MERKIYKPGQIVTVYKDNKYTQCRIIKSDGTGYHCQHCYLFPGYGSASIETTNIRRCRKYCYRVHNDWNKNPNGYYLEQICGKQDNASQ